jgi:hypothetical protein
MYGKLAAGLLTLGIAMSTTMSTPAHAAVQGKTATSFQGGCSLGCVATPHPHPHRRGHHGGRADHGVHAAYDLAGQDHV